jgi:AraC-like DNA-binding protein
VPTGRRLPAGVTMAAFSDRVETEVDVEMVPHPAVALIFDLSDGALVVEDGTVQRRERVVTGLACGGVRGRGAAGSFGCLQVRLSPVVAHAVLGDPTDLTGRMIALDDFWGPEAARLHGQLRTARSWDERFAVAAAAIGRRVDAGRAADPEVEYCWHQLAARQGRARVERLATEVGWSRKRLWSRFRAQLGLTPKRAAQLIRFDAAAHRLADGQTAAAAALASGYADQSHLHREIMAFTGTTPGALATKPFLAVDDVAWPVTSYNP